MTTKICTRCNQGFPRTNEYFNYRTMSSDGLHYVCRVCHKAQNDHYSNLRRKPKKTTPIVDIGIDGAVGLKLKQGVIVIIDDCDKHLAQFVWSARWDKTGKSYFVSRQKVINGKLTSFVIHRVIMSMAAGRELTTNELVDHKNNNTLDNRRCNLRIATKAQNNQNSRIRSDNSSGYKGVHWAKSKGGWVAQISVNGHRKYIGTYATAEEAYKAYCERAIVEHGEFANLGTNPVCPRCNGHQVLSITGDNDVPCPECGIVELSVTF